MSKYTVQLRWLVEQYIEDTLHDGISQDQWPNAYPRLGIAESGNSYNLSPYPIFDEGHRQALNDAIIRRYWNYEIGAETPDMFAWNLNDALHRIMPYYNSLYAAKLTSIAEIVTEKWNVDNTDDIVRKVLNATTGTADTKFNQNASYTMNRDVTGTADTDFTQTDKTTRQRNDTTESDGTVDTTETMNDTGTRDTVDRFLDTPQSNVQNLDDGWLTNVRKIDEDTTEERTTTTDTTTHDEGTATQNETVDYTSTQNTDTDTTDKTVETGSSKADSTTDLDTTSNSDTDDTTDRDMNETGWRIDPADWERALTVAKELFNIDRMIVEDPAIQECFMMIW